MEALAGMNSQDDDQQLPISEEELMENVKVTYDVFVQESLETTSHTIEWLNCTKQDPEFANFELNYFLTGTDTEGEASEFILLSQVRLPKLVQGQKSVIDYTKLNRNEHSKMKTLTKIPHKSGEVLKVRSKPGSSDIFASLNKQGPISIYQMSGNNYETTQVGTLLGNTSDETFALCWNKVQNNLLCSAAGSNACIWDTNNLDKDKNQLLTFRQAHGQNVIINDVKFSPLDGNLLVTSGSDGFFKVWDIRDCGYRSIVMGQASDNDLNCAAFNYVNRNLLAVGGEDTGMVGIWDLRMPDMCINDLTHHNKQVTAVEWHPTQEQMLCTGAEDGKVYIWDNTKCGEEQARKDYEDGPPELIFPHVHHQSLIEDIRWQPDQTSNKVLPMIASVENQCAIQIWKAKQDFFQEELDLLDYIDRVDDNELE